MRRSFLLCGLVSVVLYFFSAGPVLAQLNRFGGGLCFSTGIEDIDLVVTGNPGFNFRGIYEINDRWFILPVLSVYVPKTSSYPDVNLTAYYGHIDAFIGFQLAHEKQIMFYAIAGPDLTNLYQSFETDNPVYQNKYEVFPGVSVGTGIEMIIDMNFNAFAQVNYILSKYQQLIISIGAHYYFDGRRYKSWR